MRPHPPVAHTPTSRMAMALQYNTIPWWATVKALWWTQHGEFCEAYHPTSILVDSARTLLRGPGSGLWSWVMGNNTISKQLSLLAKAANKY